MNSLVAKLLLSLVAMAPSVAAEIEAEAAMWKQHPDGAQKAADVITGVAHLASTFSTAYGEMAAQPSNPSAGG